MLVSVCLLKCVWEESVFGGRRAVGLWQYI